MPLPPTRRKKRDEWGTLGLIRKELSYGDAWATRPNRKLGAGEKVTLCVGILIVITILNLRGVREAGTAFAVPTYLFVGTLLLTIVAGVFSVLLSGGRLTPAVPLPPPPPMTEAVSYWLC